jgi:hypothetical protein
MIPRRLSVFWLGLALILALAAVPRLLSYSFSLPYIDHPDEPNYYVAGQIWRGLMPPDPYYGGVPPGYPVLHTVFQPLVEAANLKTSSDAIRFMRLLSVIANLLTLAAIALAARLAAGDLAGLVAGAAWGAAPLVLQNGVYALPDPYVYLFTAAALWLAAGAVVKPKRSWWALWSVVSGLLAVLMKYPALPALAPGVLAALAVFARDRRTDLRLLFLQVLLIGGVGLWLVFGYGVDFNHLQREGAVIQQQGWTNFLNLSRAANNVYYALVPLNAVAFGLFALAGIAAWLIARREHKPTANLLILGMCMLLVVSIPWLANTFSEVNDSTIRYVLPATTAACVIFGAALGQVAAVLPVKQPAARGLVTALPLLALVWLPQAQVDAGIVRDRGLPDRRVALREWFDQNLDTGTVIVNNDNHKTFNPLWGGIPYQHWTDWWISNDVMEHPVDEWRKARGMSYAVLDKAGEQGMLASDAGRAYLGQMLHLRDFVETPARGPAMAVYRLWRMEHETTVQFGDTITLVGFDGDAARATRGQPLALRFYWQTAGTPPDNYSLFIHLVPLDGEVPLAQADGAPASDARPTLTWNDPGETLISQPFALNIPPNMPAGEYRLKIGLYNYETGARLPVKDGGAAAGDAYELMRVKLE